MNRLLLAGAFALLAVSAAAQTPVVIRDGSTGAEKGTSGAPIRTDPTGSTTQPVSGTVSIGNITTDTDDASVAGGQNATLNVSLLRMWDGSAWARVAGDESGLFVNIQAGNVGATQQGIWSTSALGKYRASPPVLTDGATQELLLDNAGKVIVSVGNTVTVSGTVTANAGTNLNTSALALESGGNLATVASAVRAEDSASADGDKGVALLARRAATPADTSGTDGDYEALQLKSGRLWASAVIDTALPAGNNNIGDVDVVTLPAVTFTQSGTSNAVKLTDGTNIAAVKAASTAAVATDPAAVIAFSPNSALPTGSNTIGAVTQASGPWTSNLTQVGGQTTLQGNQNNVASATGAINTAPIGRYDATQPTLTDTRFNMLQLSSRGALFVATGADTFHVTCDSGCTPGGSFADRSAFTFGTTAINNTGYVVDDTPASYVAENSAGVGRMSPTSVPYADLSKDSSGLVALVLQLQQLVAEMRSSYTTGGVQRAGMSLRAGAFNKLVGPGNPLPVALPDAPDPCNQRKGTVAVSQTATTKQIPGLPGKLIAICYGRLIVGAAEVVALTEGTGTNCGTGTAAVSGSTTAANGESFAANGGWSGGMGLGTVAATRTPGDDLCVQQSGANRVAGELLYVYY